MRGPCLLVATGRRGLGGRLSAGRPLAAGPVGGTRRSDETRRDRWRSPRCPPAWRWRGRCIHDLRDQSRREAPSRAAARRPPAGSRDRQTRQRRGGRREPAAECPPTRVVPPKRKRYCLFHDPAPRRSGRATCHPCRCGGSATRRGPVDGAVVAEANPSVGGAGSTGRRVGSSADLCAWHLARILNRYPSTIASG